MIIFISLRIKEVYDFRYKSIFFNIGDYINLYLYRGYKVLEVLLKKLKS